MKSWKCRVCGFIHRDTDPPENCPVCGATKDKFDTVEEKTASAPTAQPEEKASARADAWRCTVCGYIHRGPEPPDVCPVCGADKSSFEPYTAPADTADKSEAPQPAAATPATIKAPAHWTITRLLVKNHAHPVSVHFPNGVFPVAVLFILLYLVVQLVGLPVNRAHYFAVAGMLNALVVLLAMPFVIVSGLADWKVRFKGVMTKVFKIKIACAVAVTLGTAALLLWALFFPYYTFKHPVGKYIFWLAHLPVLGAAGLAGFLGGKLVFIDDDH